MATQNVKRIINGEQGMVLSKQYNEPRGEMVINGRTIPAKGETFKVTIISSPEFDKEKGYVNGCIMDYETTKEQFEKTAYGNSVKVTYEFSNFGTKPISYELAPSSK